MEIDYYISGAVKTDHKALRHRIDRWYERFERVSYDQKHDTNELENELNSEGNLECQ